MKTKKPIFQGIEKGTIIKAISDSQFSMYKTGDIATIILHAEDRPNSYIVDYQGKEITVLAENWEVVG
jgi:hypothetical protein